MQQRNRTQLALGVILILVAAWLIAVRIWPEQLENLIQLQLTFDWPVWVMIAGGIILLIGLLVGSPGMAVPACIVTGIGGILYYQEATNHWETWSYMWTLVPGFVGIGVLLSGILGQDFKENVKHGLNLILISVILFAIFGTLLGGTKLLGPFAEYGPIVLLFLLGLWLIVRGILRHKS